MDRKARGRLVIGLSSMLILLGLAALTQTRTAAAVFVQSFTAEWQDSAVQVNWTTAQEVDNVAFRVRRSTSASSGFTTIGSKPSCGPGGITGCSYSYADQDVTAGQTYYYKLQSVDNNQQVQDAAGPVCAQGNTPCNLQGPTNTPRPATATLTPQPPTATKTPRPTKTRTPVPTTAVPTKTATALNPTATRTPISPDLPVGTDVPVVNDVPTETDVPLVADNGVESTPVATKFAHIVGSQPTVVLATSVPGATDVGAEAAPTETQDPAPSPEAGSTLVASNALGTPRATTRAASSKPKVPSTVRVSAARELNLPLLFGALGVVALDAAGFVGLVGLLYWYFGRAD
jgi:hypothetical protein